MYGTIRSVLATLVAGSAHPWKTTRVPCPPSAKAQCVAWCKATVSGPSKPEVLGCLFSFRTCWSWYKGYGMMTQLKLLCGCHKDRYCIYAPVLSGYCWDVGCVPGAAAACLFLTITMRLLVHANATACRHQTKSRSSKPQKNRNAKRFAGVRELCTGMGSPESKPPEPERGRSLALSAYCQCVCRSLEPDYSSGAISIRCSLIQRRRTFGLAQREVIFLRESPADCVGLANDEQLSTGSESAWHRRRFTKRASLPTMRGGARP